MHFIPEYLIFVSNSGTPLLVLSDLARGVGALMLDGTFQLRRASVVTLYCILCPGLDLNLISVLSEETEVTKGVISKLGFGLVFVKPKVYDHLI